MNKISNPESQNINKKIYLLIDEIQEVTGWEKAIRSFMADLDCDIYLTGSNARLLSSELVTYLLATEEVVQREYLPLTTIKDNYQKLVLSLDRITISTKDGIEWMNVIDFIRNINKQN